MKSELLSFVRRRPFRSFVIHLVDGREHVIFDPGVVRFGSWIEGAKGVMIQINEKDARQGKSFEFVEFESIVCIAPWRWFSPRWKPAVN